MVRRATAAVKRVAHTARATISTTTAMSRTAETCRAQRYSEEVGWSSRMTADREEPPIHEPGDDDGSGDETEEIAGGAEEDELEGAHREGRVGRADDLSPAGRGRRRGGRLCTSPVYGAVSLASSAGPHGCSESRTDVVPSMCATAARDPTRIVLG